MKFIHDQEVDAAILDFGNVEGKFSHNEAVMLDRGQVILDITDTGAISKIEFLEASTVLGERTISSLSGLNAL